MKIYHIPNYQYNNYYAQNRVQAPHFTSIKSTTPDGLYRKQGEEAKKITDALQKNPDAIEFFKKNDVHLGYHAVQIENLSYSSSLHIRYRLPAQNKVQAFFEKFKSPKEIVIHGFGSTLEESTEKLVEYILPKSEENGTGMLSAHIQSAQEEIQKILNKREAKKEAKQAEKQAKIDAKQKQKDDKQAVEQSVKDLENIVNG